jgi:signal peptide peptidase SppA
MIDLCSIYAISSAVPTSDRLTKPAKVKSRRDEIISVISITGVLDVRPSWWGRVTNTTSVTEAVRAATVDPAVAAILLAIDSPGGNAAGVVDLSDAIATAAKTKPTFSSIVGVAGSGAYLAISRSSRIYASRGSLVGGLGTFAVLSDSSELAGKLGIKVHVVKAGEFKGVGVDGAPVTERHLAEVQRLVNDINHQFTESVREGRKLLPSQLDRVITGQMWTAADGWIRKLVDAIGGFDVALDALVKEIVPSDAAAFQRFSSMTQGKSRYDREQMRARFPRLAARAASWRHNETRRG